MQLDELINKFLGLSQLIADAIVSDEKIERVRQLDEEMSAVFDAILCHETRDETDRLRKTHFLIDQIVASEDQTRRQQLAEQVKNSITTHAG